MRAVVQHDYGGPETLRVEEIDQPAVGSGQVLVRVRAAALNPTDYVVMRGFLRPQTGWQRPKQQVRGFDVAGMGRTSAYIPDSLASAILQNPRQRFDEQAMLGHRVDMCAAGLAIPARDAGEPVGDVLDLDIERGGVEQIEPPARQHALPGARAGSQTTLWRRPARP